MKKIGWLVITIITIVIMAACATISVGDSQKVSITSDPSDAIVTVTDNATGNVVTEGTTPFEAKLKRGTGEWAEAASYTVTIEKEGYKAYNIPLEGKINGFYTIGNFFLGGLIGWLIVDPLSGAMYTLTPEKVEAKMTDETASDETMIHIILVEDENSEILAKATFVGILD